MHLSFLSPLLLIPGVLSHGLITKPTPRGPGDASLAACGSAVTKDIKSDLTSHVEGLPELAAKDKSYSAEKCNLWLCRGLQFEDNKANVVALMPGQKMSLNVKVTIKHTGTANVSIVSTKTNKILGKQLIFFDDYANNKYTTLPVNNTAIDITIPTDLGSACAVAGDCVVQWWWYGTGARQTYESCVDVTISPMSMPMKKMARRE